MVLVDDKGKMVYPKKGVGYFAHQPTIVVEADGVTERNMTGVDYFAIYRPVLLDGVVNKNGDPVYRDYALSDIKVGEQYVYPRITAECLNDGAGNHVYGKIDIPYDSIITITGFYNQFYYFTIDGITGEFCDSNLDALYGQL